MEPERKYYIKLEFVQPLPPGQNFIGKCAAGLIGYPDFPPNHMNMVKARREEFAFIKNNNTHLVK